MATAGGIGQGIAAAVNGFMKGRQLAKDWAEAEEDREWKKTARDRQQKEWDAADAEVNMLKDAGAERVVQEIPDAAGTQAYMKATEQGPAAETPQIDFTAPSGFAVALQPSADGKTPMKFDNVAQLVDTREAASAAAQQANAPEAIAQRMAAGYNRLGKPKEAMAIATQQLSLQQAQQDAADRVWKRDLGQAMVQGHEGLAALGSRSEFGPMKGVQVRAVTGSDGMVNYMRVGEDGQLSSLGLPAFSNDQEGVIRAGAMLNHLTPPEKRLEFLLAEKKAAQEQANADRNYNLAVRGENRADRAQNRADRTADRQDRLTDAQISRYEREGRDAEAEAKISPATKLQVQASQKQLDTINTAITKAMADGSWDPSSEGAKSLLAQQKALNNQVNEALLPYRIRGGGADTFGVRAATGRPAAPAPARPASAKPNSAYVGASPQAKSDAILILQRELAQPNLSPADRAAIERELVRAGGEVPQKGGAGGAAASAAPAPAAYPPVAQAAPAVAAPAPAKAYPPVAQRTPGTPTAPAPSGEKVKATAENGWNTDPNKAAAYVARQREAAAKYAEYKRQRDEDMEAWRRRFGVDAKTRQETRDNWAKSVGQLRSDREKTKAAAAAKENKQS